jgi:hypothetical protein
MMATKDNNKKIPQRAFSPPTSKEPTHTRNPNSYETQLIAWHFECMDVAGSWPCSLSTLQAIKHRLHEYEKRRWSELTGSSHPFPVEQIIPKAQRRLDELGYGDYGQLYQLDIRSAGQKQRLWGLRRENIFKILWWDPNHEIYPVQKRGT